MPFEEVGLDVTIRNSMQGAQAFAEEKAALETLGMHIGQVESLTVNYGNSVARVAKEHEGAAASSRSFEEAMHHSSRLLGETGDQAEHLSTRLGALNGLMGSGLGTAGLALGMTAALGAAIEGMNKTSEQAERNAKAMDLLKQAFASQGKTLESVLPQINQWLEKNAQFIPDIDQAREGLATFIRAGFDYPTAINAMDDALNLAALKHIDLATAAHAVVLAMEGNGRALKDLGIDVKALAKEDDNAVQAHKNLETATVAVEKATKSHDDAVRKLAEANAALSAKHTVTQAELMHIQDLEARVRATTDDLTTANSGLSAAQGEVAKSSATAQQVLRELKDKTDGATDSITESERATNKMNSEFARLSDKVGPAWNTAMAEMKGSTGAFLGWIADHIDPLLSFVNRVHDLEGASLSNLANLVGVVGGAMSGAGGGGGSSPGPLSSGFGSGPGHGNAAGGMVGAGSTRWVGESGPELVTFGTSGYVTPNQAVAGMAGAGRGDVNVSITVNAQTDATPQDIADAVNRNLMRSLRRNSAFVA